MVYMWLCGHTENTFAQFEQDMMQFPKQSLQLERTVRSIQTRYALSFFTEFFAGEEQRKATSVRAMLNGRWFLTRVFCTWALQKLENRTLGREQNWISVVEVMTKPLS